MADLKKKFDGGDDKIIKVAELKKYQKLRQWTLTILFFYSYLSFSFLLFYFWNLELGLMRHHCYNVTHQSHGHVSHRKA